jgi:hypothetical protein
MTHWKNVVERRRGRGFRSRPLLALRKRTAMMMMRGWRSAWATAPRSGPGPRRPRRDPLAARSHPRRGQQRPCPECGRQPSLPPSLSWYKRQGPWRGKSPPSPRKPAWRLWVRGPEPLSGRPLRGKRRRGPSPPSCSHSRARSGPNHRSTPLHRGL